MTLELVGVPLARAEGSSIGFFIAARQLSDCTGAAAFLGGLPSADWLLADRGYDADWSERY